MLVRGGHPLPHQSQVVRRDLAAELIRHRRGHTALGYVLTDEQLREPRNTYRYLVHSPGDAALAWKAFHTEEALRAFVRAYGLKLRGPLVKGERFSVEIPQQPRFAALRDDERQANPKRPPKEWWDDCVAGVAETSQAYDPASVCGALWYRKMSPAKKREAVAREKNPTRGYLWNAFALRSG